jgi:hypothetical protein
MSLRPLSQLLCFFAALLHVASTAAPDPCDLLKKHDFTWLLSALTSHSGKGIFRKDVAALVQDLGIAQHVDVSQWFNEAAKDAGLASSADKIPGRSLHRDVADSLMQLQSTVRCRCAGSFCEALHAGRRQEGGSQDQQLRSKVKQLLAKQLGAG